MLLGGELSDSSTVLTSFSTRTVTRCIIDEDERLAGGVDVSRCTQREH